MTYQHLYTEEYDTINLGTTIRLGDIFDDFFDAVHYTIKMKEKLPNAKHSIVDIKANKVICILRAI